MRKVFVTGIGTDVGKTVIAAIITEALQADYWKPIQCGSLELSDTERVKRLVSCEKTVFHPEAYRFENPVSPHYAAELADKKVRLGKLKAPETENTLVIEGAGGILVPYNYRGDTMLDIVKENNAEVIVVSRNYLGSINHTMLTMEALKQAEVPVLGIIFNGPHTPSTEDVVINKTKSRILGRVKEEFEITREIIKQYAHDYVFI